MTPNRVLVPVLAVVVLAGLGFALDWLLGIGPFILFFLATSSLLVGSLLALRRLWPTITDSRAFNALSVLLWLCWLGAQAWFLARSPRALLPRHQRAAEIIFLEGPTLLNLLAGVVVAIAVATAGLHAWHPKVNLLKPLAILGVAALVFLAWFAALSQ